MTNPDDIPAALQGLAAELDDLGRTSAAPQSETLPSFEGTDFRLEGLIGKGGMGTVYAAHQLSLDRPVAIKLLGSGGLSEARMIARLHHPHIVETIAAGKTEGRLYFAMELIQGEDAAHHTFASDAELVLFGRAVAQALGYAHDCGILHRDVKPSNVFIRTDGAVKLGDFGLASLAHTDLRDQSGTHRYMAPEQLKTGTTSTQSDQYAWGVMMRELSGTFPKLLKDPDFAAILAKATTEDPVNRYADMHAVEADLARFLAHEPVRAVRSSIAHRLCLWMRRNPLGASCAALASLFLIAFVVALAIGYVRTARALAAAEQEAAHAAQALAASITEVDRSAPDLRAAELTRALRIAANLRTRFPANDEIRAACDRLQKAADWHASHPRPTRERRRIH